MASSSPPSHSDLQVMRVRIVEVRPSPHRADPHARFLVHDHRVRERAGACAGQPEIPGDRNRFLPDRQAARGAPPDVSKLSATRVAHRSTSTNSTTINSSAPARPSRAGRLVRSRFMRGCPSRQRDDRRHAEAGQRRARQRQQQDADDHHHRDRREHDPRAHDLADRSAPALAAQRVNLRARHEVSTDRRRDHQQPGAKVIAIHERAKRAGAARRRARSRRAHCAATPLSAGPR